MVKILPLEILFFKIFRVNLILKSKIPFLKIKNWNILFDWLNFTF